jgi:hypothetical protein
VILLAAVDSADQHAIEVRAEAGRERVYRDGVPAGPAAGRIVLSSLRTDGDHLAWAARDGGRWRIFLDGVAGPALRTLETGSVTLCPGGHVAAQVQADGSVRVLFDGQLQDTWPATCPRVGEDVAGADAGSGEDAAVGAGAVWARAVGAAPAPPGAVEPEALSPEHPLAPASPSPRDPRAPVHIVTADGRDRVVCEDGAGPHRLSPSFDHILDWSFVVDGGRWGAVVMRRTGYAYLVVDGRPIAPARIDAVIGPTAATVEPRAAILRARVRRALAGPQPGSGDGA